MLNGLKMHKRKNLATVPLSFITKHSRITVFLLVVILAGCSKKIAPESPDEEYDTSAINALVNETSYITVPLEINIKELERQLNTEFTGLIYEDNSFDGDDLKVKIWKQKNMSFVARSDGFYAFRLPLKIWVEKQVSVLGMKQTPATEFEIVANFSSKPFITSSWQLNTLTNAEGFSWVTQPKLS